MALVSSYLSIITLNVKGLNSPIRRHEEAGWMKKEQTTYCPEETSFSFRNTQKIKVKGWKKDSMEVETKKEQG